MIMALKGSFLAAFAVLSTANAAAVGPAREHVNDIPRYRANRTNVVYELKIAEVIPTVLHPFTPRYLLDITWPSGASIGLGNTEAPFLLQDIPSRISLSFPADTDKHNEDDEYEDYCDDEDYCASTSPRPQLKTQTLSPSAAVPLSQFDPSALRNTATRKRNDDEEPPHTCDNLIIALTDPDAPSRDNPVWSEVCHYLLYCVRDQLVTLAEYKPPGPPPWTGKHRYVAAAMVPRNGTGDVLWLNKIEERQRWGYDDERSGLSKWADEHELEVVAANFLYSQDEIQGGWSSEGKTMYEEL